jgi:hypothetical protein
MTTRLKKTIGRIFDSIYGSFIDTYNTLRSSGNFIATVMGQIGEDVEKMIKECDAGNQAACERAVKLGDMIRTAFNTTQPK